MKRLKGNYLPEVSQEEKNPGFQYSPCRGTFLLCLNQTFHIWLLRGASKVACFRILDLHLRGIQDGSC